MFSFRRRKQEARGAVVAVQTAEEPGPSLWDHIRWAGAAGKLHEAETEYQERLSEARTLIEQLEARRWAVNNQLQQVIAAKLECLPTAGKLRFVFRALRLGDVPREPEVFPGRLPEIEHAAAEQDPGAGSVVLAGAQGVALGVGASRWLWRWAGRGAASTGKLIPTLSGAARTSAILAKVGRPVAAVAGSAVAGGYVVIAAGVALPALFYLAMHVRKEANERVSTLEGELARVDEVIDQLRRVELLLELTARRSEEMLLALSRAHEALALKFEETYRELFPRGRWSRARRWMRTRLGGCYFHESEMPEVNTLLEVARTLFVLLRQPVVDMEADAKGAPQ